jgi:hypothetical protein
MRIQDIREIAKKNGVSAGKLDKRELVRAIQKAEEITIALRRRMFANAIK